MNINKNNYEAFFLDYHEGTLSAQQVADLFLFLSLHPELKKEFEEFEHIVLEDLSAPVFENKDLLKKNITADNREDYFIRAVEGTLHPSELKILEDFLAKHPEYQAEFILFKKTKLHANTSVVFESKDNLKQLTPTDHYIVSALEGLLTKEERVHFEQQLKSNPNFQKAVDVYKQTKCVSDQAIVFPFKERLKQKEKKVIPIYYYWTAAASIILLLGFFYLWQTGFDKKQPRFAEQQEPSVEMPSNTNQPVTGVNTSPVKENSNKKKNQVTLFTVKNNNKTPVKKADKGSSPLKEMDTEKEVKPLIENPSGTNFIAEKQPELKPDSLDHLQNRSIHSDFATIEKKPDALNKPSYESLSDLLALKLKEKLLGKEELEEEIKNNTSKKISAWDLAGMLANGISKLTGKKIEVKPKYNEDGNVTAYAFSAGKLQISRIK